MQTAYPLYTSISQRELYLCSCWGSAISGEGEARQPLQVCDSCGVRGIHQGQVGGLHHSTAATLLTASVPLLGAVLIPCVLRLSNTLLHSQVMRLLVVTAHCTLCHQMPEQCLCAPHQGGDMLCLQKNA